MKYLKEDKSTRYWLFACKPAWKQIEQKFHNKFTIIKFTTHFASRINWGETSGRLKKKEVKLVRNGLEGRGVVGYVGGGGVGVVGSEMGGGVGREIGGGAGSEIGGWGLER